MYLCEFSVWIDSRSANATSRPAPGMVTTWSDAADQVHLDASQVGAIPGLVGECVEVEVGPELAVDPGEDVAIEPGGHALGVVVGRLEQGAVLGQVGAEQEAVVRAEGAGHLVEQPGRVVGLVVAEAGAEEDEQLGPGVRAARLARPVR